MYVRFFITLRYVNITVTAMCLSMDFVGWRTFGVGRYSIWVTL